MDVICPTCHDPAPRKECEACKAEPVLNGQYLLLDKLGHGANGFTWRAEDQETKRILAIKELSIRKLEQFKVLDLFQRETRTLEALNHPNIPKFYEDFTVEEGRHVALYLVQEFVDGECLSVGSPWSEENARKLLVELLKTLEYLQSLSPAVYHRDIKPTNIMKRKNGDYVLIDFGSTRAAIADATVGGSTVAGTFGYMAPEQFQGQTDTSTDIYGLGATIIALLAGRDASDIVVALEPGKWKSIINVSDHLKDVLERMVEPVRSKRISSAKEALKALENEKKALVKAPGQSWVAQLKSRVQIARSKRPSTKIAIPAPRALAQDWSRTEFCDPKWWKERSSVFALSLVSWHQGVGMAIVTLVVGTLLLIVAGMLVMMAVQGLGWIITGSRWFPDFEGDIFGWVWALPGGLLVLYALFGNAVTQTVYKFDHARKRFLFTMRWGYLHRLFVDYAFSRTASSWGLSAVVVFLLTGAAAIYLTNTGGETVVAARVGLLVFIMTRVIAYVRDPVKRYFDLSVIDEGRALDLITKLTRKVHTLDTERWDPDEKDIEELTSLRSNLNAEGRAIVDGLFLLRDAKRGKLGTPLNSLLSNPTSKTKRILKDAAVSVPTKEKFEHLEHAWGLWQAAEELHHQS